MSLCDVEHNRGPRPHHNSRTTSLKGAHIQQLLLDGSGGVNKVIYGGLNLYTYPKCKLPSKSSGPLSTNNLTVGNSFTTFGALPGDYSQPLSSDA